MLENIKLVVGHKYKVIGYPLQLNEFGVNNGDICTLIDNDGSYSPLFYNENWTTTFDGGGKVYINLKNVQYLGE